MSHVFRNCCTAWSAEPTRCPASGIHQGSRRPRRLGRRPTFPCRPSSTDHARSASTEPQGPSGGADRAGQQAEPSLQDDESSFQAASMLTGFPVPTGYTASSSIYTYWRHAGRTMPVPPVAPGQASLTVEAPVGPAAPPSAADPAADELPSLGLPHSATGAAAATASSQGHPPMGSQPGSRAEPHRTGARPLALPARPRTGTPIVGSQEQQRHVRSVMPVGAARVGGGGSGESDSDCEGGSPCGEDGAMACLWPRPTSLRPVFRAAPFAAELARQRQHRDTVRILFLDEGNSCRSVLAAAVMRYMLARLRHKMDVVVETASIGWAAPGAHDPRVARIAAEMALPLQPRSAREFDELKDMVQYDLVLVMDAFDLQEVMREVAVLERINPQGLYSSRVRRLGSFGAASLRVIPGQLADDVPDPLYGATSGAAELAALRAAVHRIAFACRGLVHCLAQLQARSRAGVSLRRALAVSMQCPLLCPGVMLGRERLAERWRPVWQQGGDLYTIRWSGQQRRVVRRTSTRKAWGYWQDADNVERELRQWMGQSGTTDRLPTNRQLRQSRANTLASSITSLGGLAAFSRRMGVPLASRHPNGHWDDFANLAAELAPFLKGASGGEPDSEGTDGGEGGGARGRRARSGRLRPPPFQLAAPAAPKPRPAFPKQQQLIAAGRADLVRAIRMHGGARAVAERLGASFTHAQLQSAEQVREQLLLFVRQQQQQHGDGDGERGAVNGAEEGSPAGGRRAGRATSWTRAGPAMPTKAELLHAGRADLAYAIRRFGGFHYFASLLGLDESGAVSAPAAAAVVGAAVAAAAGPAASVLGAAGGASAAAPPASSSSTSVATATRFGTATAATSTSMVRRARGPGSMVTTVRASERGGGLGMQARAPIVARPSAACNAGEAGAAPSEPLLAVSMLLRNRGTGGTGTPPSRLSSPRQPWLLTYTASDSGQNAAGMGSTPSTPSPALGKAAGGGGQPGEGSGSAGLLPLSPADVPAQSGSEVEVGSTQPDTLDEPEEWWAAPTTLSANAASLPTSPRSGLAAADAPGATGVVPRGGIGAYCPPPPQLLSVAAAVMAFMDSMGLGRTLPSRQLLLQAGRRDLANAVQRCGGGRRVAEQLGLEFEERRGRKPKHARHVSSRIRSRPESTLADDFVLI